MAKSNKPIIWGTFAAGGEIVSLVMPVIIVLTLLAALGHAPAILTDYARLHAFAAGWFGKLVLFVILFLSLWSQAHRLRITCFDFGLRADTLVAIVMYALAAAGSVATVIYLARI
jgi:fumarate reductase subunit D